MACIGGQARKLGPKETEIFVRKMVCQDDNAPEVRTYKYFWGFHGDLES